jgi:hypothetical protein
MAPSPLDGLRSSEPVCYFFGAAFLSLADFLSSFFMPFS